MGTMRPISSDAASFCSAESAAAVLRRFADDFELRLGKLEFAAAVILLDLAVKSDDLSGLEFVPQIPGVEPDTFQARPALSRGHLKDGHAAGAEQPRGANFGDHGGHFTGAQLCDASWVQPVFIAKRQVMYKVIKGLNTFCGQQFSQTGADSLDVLNGGTQLQHLKGC